MKTIRMISCLVALCVNVLVAGAQESEGFKMQRPEFQPFFASNWGMTTSLGVPRETREIKSTSLAYCYSAGCYVTEMLAPKWGVRSGLVVERKASNSDVVMKNYFTQIVLAGGDPEHPTKGYFTGRSKNWHSVHYLTLPVLAVYRPNEKIDWHFGAYFSYSFSRDRHGESSEGQIRESLMAPPIAVTDGTDESSRFINKFDCGLQAGMVYTFWKRMFCNTDLTWGLVNVWDGTSYGMEDNIYNLYLRVGLGWKF